MQCNCEEVEQISIFLENRPGVVADLCAHLTERDISIRAIAVLDTIDIGTVRMVVDDPEKAKEALAVAGAAYVTVKCLAVEVPDRPGGFANVANKLSPAGINIEYNYALPDCEACDLLDQLTSGPSAIDVHNNLDDACTPVPVNCP